MSLETMISMLLEGSLTSLAIFALTLIGALPLGLVVAFGRMAKNPVIKGITWFYISIMRGTPLMLQLFVVYFGPYYLLGIQSSPDWRFTAVITAFIINYAAYFAEIYRGGIESIDRGQYEAAEVLGYSSLQTFFLIILPQVIKRILPSLTNEVITLIKDTSLAFVISVSEMFTVAKAIVAAQKTMTAFGIAALFYYVFNAIVSFIMGRIERVFDFYKED